MNVTLDSPPTLRHVKVGIRPFNPHCFTEEVIEKPQYTKWWNFIANAKHKICAGNFLQRIDHGDSGGPLLYRRNNTIYQIGLAEFILTSIDNVGKPGKFGISGNHEINFV